MKKIMIIACALVVVAISATAAQKNINTRDIEHPRLLEAALDNNFDELYAADVNLGTNAVAASRLTGNVAVARITNAAATVGASIGGNIPVAAMTNAAGSIGAFIGGNVPLASVTNAGATLGPYVLGNIPAASLTNALATAVIPLAGITNALASAGATIGGNVNVASITNALTTGGASIGGNIPVAAISNAFQATLQPAYAAGKFSIAATTQLVFIASGVTNVIDEDITTP